MHRLQERLEQFCSELPSLKIIDRGTSFEVKWEGSLGHLSIKIAIIEKRWFVGRLPPIHRKKSVSNGPCSQLGCARTLGRAANNLEAAHYSHVSASDRELPVAADSSRRLILRSMSKRTHE